MSIDPGRLLTACFALVCLVPQYVSAQNAPQRLESSAFVRGIATADSVIGAAIGTLTPGAVFLVARNGSVVHERAFGYAQTRASDAGGRASHPIEPPRRMTTSTMFDAASVTKVMATTMAVMLLVDRNRIQLDAPVYLYLHDFRGAHLDSITVRHLLQHSSGLVQWQPLYYQASNKAETYRAIREMPLAWGVGEGRHYSDLGFMLLGYIIERVSGKPLDAFVESEIYRAMGLRHTAFNPKRRGFTGFAATEEGNGYERHMVYDSTFGYRYRGDPASWNKWRTHILVGETNDGNAFYAHDGAAGHAGLFSTAADLRVLIDLLNNEGVANGRRFIKSRVVRDFLTRDRYGHYLGWQQPPGLPDGSFMHTGFTGTYVLGVPRHHLAIVLLTNRQHLGTDEKGFFPNLTALQAAVANAVVRGASGDLSSAGSGRSVAHFEAADFQSGRWIKGNTHTHTLESDGDSPPAVVTKWYKDHGYNFLVLSDHNVWVDPARLSSFVDSSFILIPGEELTSRFGTKPVHVNGLNIPGVIAAATDSTLLGTIQKNVDAVRKVEGVPHINHPNFGWAITQDVLEKVQNDKLIEIHNGHPLVHNEGGGDSPGMEAVWDYLLTRGKRIFGIAVDDAHAFQGEFAPGRSNPGRGWVTVRAGKLEAREIMTQLEKGRFYASSGVELDSVIVRQTNLAIFIRNRGDFKFTTQFIGRDGVVLSTTGANPATYTLSGNETYVRPRVRNSAGEVAWLQPLFVER
ncbi:MAG TPA: serine hydrolase [Gemmatimonadaceae bacterium]|nr:serine hydrolase [Gemmatimonadaceae bacterium]